MGDCGGNLGVFATFLVGAGLLYHHWWNSPVQRAIRLLHSVPQTPVGSLRPGQRARISGRTLLRDALVAPFGGTRCAAFHMRIDEPQGKNSWRTLAKDEACVPFLVEDATGACFVDPRGTTLHLQFDPETQQGLFQEPGPNQRSVLEKHGIEVTNSLGFHRQLRFREAVLAEGETVSLLGVVEIIEIDGVPTLTLVPDPEHGLVLTDHSIPDV
jgi:hypothetical protein